MPFDVIEVGVNEETPDPSRSELIIIGKLDRAKQAVVAEVLNVQLMILRNECGVSPPEWDEARTIWTSGRGTRTCTKRVIARCPCVNVCGEDA